MDDNVELFAPYSDEVGDTLAEFDVKIGDEQPFTGTRLAVEDEPV